MQALKEAKIEVKKIVKYTKNNIYTSKIRQRGMYFLDSGVLCKSNEMS